MTKTLALSLIIVALVIGVGLGFMISPEYANMGMAQEHSFELGNSDENYDLRFLDGMIAHHMGAIDMAKVTKEKSKNPILIDLTNNIIDLQEKEIKQMYAWKKEWYDNSLEVNMNDYSMNPNLGEYDQKFDLRFINAMVAHHNMAIEMSKDAQKKSYRNEILNIAGSIIFNQSQEVDFLNELRFKEYGIK